MKLTIEMDRADYENRAQDETELLTMLYAGHNQSVIEELRRAFRNFDKYGADSTSDINNFVDSLRELVNEFKVVE